MVCVQESNDITLGKPRHTLAEPDNLAHCLMPYGDRLCRDNRRRTVQDHLIVVSILLSQACKIHTKSEWQSPDEIVRTNISSCLGLGTGISCSLMVTVRGSNLAAFIDFAIFHSNSLVSWKAISLSRSFTKSWVGYLFT